MRFSRGVTAVIAGGCCWVACSLAVAALPSEHWDSGDSLAIQPAVHTEVADDCPCAPSSACGDCGACCECCPLQVWASAMFLTRSGAGNVPLVFGDPNTPKGSEVLGTDDLNFGFGWGPAVGASYCLNACNRIGVEFYAIDGWTATDQISGNYSVQFPSFPYLPELGTPGAPNTGFGTATFRYTSNLYNTEINVYHRSNDFCWLTTLAGFRWIEISEQFSTVFETGATSPNYAIDVNNHLYGVQVGALVGLQNWGDWYIDGWLKAGIYGAACSQSTTEDFTSADGVVTFISASDANTAFAGDIGVSLTRRITDRLSLRLSYMVLWIEGIALAPEQLDNSDPSNGIATVDSSGGAFYHGGFIGCEYLW